LKLKIDNEFKSLIPALTKEEFEQLERNCIDEGVREPIIVWTGTDTIIDGHNRYEIAQKHNLHFTTFGKGFNSRDEVMLWMIINQFGRRNLSAYDRCKLALRLKPIFEEKAKEKINEGINQYSPCQISDKPTIDTKKEIAKIADVSHDTIAKVQKIEAKAPEKVKEQIKSGEISINQAYQQVRRNEKIEAIKKIVVDKKAESKSIDINNPAKKYNIIYADPAWQYFENGNKNQSLHYNTMSIKDICNLPIQNISDDNCILFIWVTFPILKEAFNVIESWGFKYSTCGFNWIKKNKVADTNFFGCGAWTRANSELCLIATKGSILRLDNTISQVLETPIEGHSKKPAIVRELITKLVGELPRIELFCRDSENGWDCWGDMV
jgi:N6-adenosine-specific RNA methylase IME4